eukprot:TRINITY_DN21528_c0_g1_i1.p1 TRINITY_DN21528_c0_g1~~TRINITY_DN21528_c0_g1_i1.p1  ORF type:complete len:233 (-),score=78.01 TRINITY_DN21528_c0_g1_i1:80-778(-)
MVAAEEAPAPPVPVPAQTADRRARVLVVAGPIGSGKTSLIRALAAERPSGESWAVLLNEAGNAEAPAETKDEKEGGGLFVHMLLGTCVCCTGSDVPLRTALVRLLRRARPSLLILELSTLGLPGRLTSLLRRDFAKNTILPCDVTVVVPTAMHEELVAGSEAYREQLQAAGVLAVLRPPSDEAAPASAAGGDEEAEALRAWASKQEPAKEVRLLRLQGSAPLLPSLLRPEAA